MTRKIPAPAPAPMAAGGPAGRWPATLRTPCYVFDPAVVVARHAALRAALDTGLLVSLKANPDTDLFARCAHAFEDGVEVASAGELEMVVGRGRHAIYLNNPALDDDLIRAGIASRCHVVVDGADMAERLVALARPALPDRAGRPVPVLLRINVAALLGQAAPPACTDHFGMAPAEAVVVARRLGDAGLHVVGLHAFSGSNTFRLAEAGPQAGRPAGAPDALALATALGRLADSLSATLREPLTCLNLGGGFAEGGHVGSDRQRYRARLTPLADRYRLLHEAGRAIYADAGEFITRIVAVKEGADRIVAVCDGGLSHDFLLAQTEAVLKRWRVPRLVGGEAGPTAARTDARPVFFVGNTCHRGDVIGRLPPGSTPPRRGQFAVFERCGAYHSTYTVSGFLSQRAPAVYIRQGSDR